MLNFDDDVLVGQDDIDASVATMSVSEFVRHVNGILKRGLAGGVWVQGEIESFNDRNKHTYFNLVERDGKANATVNVALWDGIRNRLRPMLERHRLELGNGIKVRVHGVADVWDVNGKFSFKVDNIDPLFTLGDLAGQRDEVIKKLRELGLYDSNKRIEVPIVPLRVALVTSVGSAAHRDAEKELAESGIGFSIFTYDVRVQGEGAVPSLVAALNHCSKRNDIDVVMVVRGGGSRTDLLAYDTLEVTSAIGRCAKPVFVGVGHEVDTSVADEVANRAFKTPTACAAGVVDLVNAYVDRTEQAWDSIARHALDVVREAEQFLSESAHMVRHRVNEIVRVGEHTIVSATTRLSRRPLDVVRSARREVDAIAERVRLLDPQTTLARGWSMTKTASGKTIRSVSQVAAGEELVTHLVDGTITSTVQSTTARKGK